MGWFILPLVVLPLLVFLYRAGATNTMIKPINIDREELRERLAQGNDLKLVMAASNFGFRSKHLPGSLHFDSNEQMFAQLKPDDDIVVYCSNADCHASLAVYQALHDRGYRRIRHYSGGLFDWESAGLPLEGDWADGTTTSGP